MGDDLCVPQEGSASGESDGDLLDSAFGVETESGHADLFMECFVGDTNDEVLELLETSSPRLLETSSTSQLGSSMAEEQHCIDPKSDEVRDFGGAINQERLRRGSYYMSSPRSDEGYQGGIPCSRGGQRARNARSGADRKHIVATLPPSPSTRAKATPKLSKDGCELLAFLKSIDLEEHLNLLLREKFTLKVMVSGARAPK